MTLLTGVPDRQRLFTGESLCVSVRAPDDVKVSWWRDGKLETEGPTLSRSEMRTEDAGTYVVLAVKDDQHEAHAVPVAVAPVERSISIELPRKWHGASVVAVLVLAILVATALARGPVARAVDLSQLDDARPDTALIALVVAATGIVLLIAGVFVGVITVLARAQSDMPDTVMADGVDPGTVSRVVSSLDRPRLTAALLVAGLLLVAVAAILAWRLAGAPPPAAEAAGVAVQGEVWALEAPTA